MSLVSNKSYKLQTVMNQMEDVHSTEEFIERFRYCFPVVWIRIQYFHEMDMSDKFKRKYDRIPEPRVYVEKLYKDAMKNYEKEK